LKIKSILIPRLSREYRSATPVCRIAIAKPGCPDLQHVDFKGVFINPSLTVPAASRTAFDGRTDMFRFAASAIALLVAFSVLPVASSEAGNRSERHRVAKHQKFRMIDRNANRFDRRHIRRVVARAVVKIRVDGGGRSIHRRYRQGDTYSGDVIINVRNGVGQWSYGAVTSVSVTVAPRVKIIDVGAQKPNSACHMQAGVCVIKP
jgi:hypothetical protein